MPKLGNTVESSIIVEWRKRVGDRVEEGEPLVDVETDKATVEVPSPAAGTLLAIFFEPGADVPVMTTIAAIGELGEDASQLQAGGAVSPAGHADAVAAPVASPVPPVAGAAAPASAESALVGVSPRARRLAGSKGLATEGLPGTGPGGRIIERDVVAALATQPRLSPVARAKVAEGEFVLPEEGRGSGPGGRIMARDLAPAAPAPAAAPPAVPALQAPAGEPEVIKLAGVRKVIAERMLASLQTTAQLTLNSSADARGLLAFRQRLKASPEELGLRQVTINDLILLAVARTLPHHPDLNAHLVGDTLTRFPYVNLGVAVDTPRGLMVPVIRQAEQWSLRQLSQEAKRLAAACLERRATPDELSGGTFTVTNLGSLGVESFTPVLNPPEVAILGVGNIGLKPVEVDGDVQFVPHLSLSLTINHQVVDGAPGARFLQALARGLADFDLLLAL
jgi:pyruvate dehydrogenase E2 component (dihydrolipoamide acetyltransferase)